MLRIRILALLSMASFACASDLSDRLDGQEDELGEPLLVESVLEGSATLTRVDASSSELWVHYRFADDQAFTGAELGQTNGELWDVAFQRFRVRTNGGVSGDGAVEVAVLTEVAFDGVSEAPNDGYSEDEPDADNDGDIEPVFETVEGGWYIYDFATHTLSPNALVYVVKTHDEQFYKMEFASYYDEAGSSGHPSFMHESVSAPATTP
ncbi:MAG: HmuY family protein [Myxococcota bacterium]